MIENGVQWTTHVKIINLGNQIIPSTQVAFIVNRSTELGEYEIYSIIYDLANVIPHQILDFSASWVPLNIGVYSAGWMVGDVNELYRVFDMYYGGTNFDFSSGEDPYSGDVNILSNFLLRSVYVIDGTFYNQKKLEFFRIFPDKLFPIRRAGFWHLYSILIEASNRFLF